MLRQFLAALRSAFRTYSSPHWEDRKVSRESREVEGCLGCFSARRRRLEFGHSENDLGRGVRRDALLTAAGKVGSAVSKASRLTFPGLKPG